MDVTNPAPGVRQPSLLAALRSEKLLSLALAGTLLLALGLRFYGLDWDEGYSFTPHPDERAILMNVGELRFPSVGDLHLLGSAEESPWNPGWFPYGSFPLYLLRLVQYGYDWLPGADLHDLRIAGRAISALADVATVAVLYLLGRRVYGRREGLLAAFMASIAVIHIQLSHFYAVDTLLALFTVAALYFMYRIARDGRPRDSVLAGVFIGLGLATKISQAPILLGFAMAHVLFVTAALSPGAATVVVRDRIRASLQGIAGGVAGSLSVLVVAQPYMLLDWSRFYSDFVEQSEMVRRIRDYPYTRQYVDTTPYWYHVRQLATWGLGWPLGIVAWAGLVYAALRGSPLRFGLAYIAVGWVLPMVLLLYSTSIPAILAASVIALAATVSMIPLRSRETRLDLLLLAWVVPYLLVIGALEVKFLRYLIPVTPVLLLFGARLMLAVWDAVSRSRPSLRPVAVIAGVLVLAATCFYALAYVSIYGEPHTGVRTSAWLKSNAPEGAVVLKEHWEEGIPDIGGPELPLYENDTPQKLEHVSEMLAEADYLVFYSNRLYGTIPRLPERYPTSREYYRALFSGRLGYELANAETAYPTLAGISFVHETFARPDLPVPEGLGAFEPATRRLQLGFADESFSVYDHPTGMVFRNAARFDAGTIRRTLEAAVPEDRSATTEAGGREVGLLLSSKDAEAQREGGTWTDIVRTESWTNRMPVLSWLIVVEGLALLVWPLTFPLFRPLADRGYLFAKLAGLLGVALIAWLLASLKWATFSAGTIGLAAAAIAVASLIVLFRQRAQIRDFVRAHWRVLVVGEAVFLIAFFAFVALRMANPDLWHPHLGGEKPMDFAYLNAVLKSSYMPPYDPWFAGGYLNYYYWGQFITATLIHATGIEPSLAYNLAVPLFFALTAAAAFSLVANLAETTRLRKAPSAVLELGGIGRSKKFPWPSVLAGLAGVVFVTVLGNLDGAVQVGQGIWRATIGHVPFGAFDFWRSSRMMPPGNEITEFPFFTFLFADLHAHLMALPFTLLALGLSLAVLLSGSRHRDDMPSRWAPSTLAQLVAVGIVVGALRLINTWDYPIYLLIAAASVFLAAYFSNGGLSLAVLIESGMKSALVFLAGYLVFLPYHLSYETFFTSIEGTTNTTVLWRFLGITGLFVFIIGSFFLRESTPWLLQAWLSLKRRAIAFVAVPAASSSAGPQSDEGSGIALARLAVLAAAALGAGFLAYMAISAWVGSTIPFISALTALILVVGVGFMRSARVDAPQLAFVAVIVGISLVLVIGLDVYRVEGDIDRMNSIFKFYLQIWVMLAVAAAYLLWRFWDGKRIPLSHLGSGKKLWLSGLAVLVVSASVYPILGTQARLRTRFDPRPATLDGAAYMRDAVYRDARGSIDLATDYEGIRWLQREVEGSPVVLEGVTPQYRWGGRISVYTGLPSVVGWKWHQEQQRWDYRWIVGERQQDVDTIYSTDDAEQAVGLMREYGVEYVYVGQLERLYYPEAGLAKFENALTEDLELVFQTADVTIYRLRSG